MLDGLDLEAALGMGGGGESPGGDGGESAACFLQEGGRHFFHHAKDPDRLREIVGSWEMRDGDCHHVATVAMVDSFTWLKILMGLQDAEYVAVSTYAIFPDAVSWIMGQWEAGHIGRVDFYLGDNNLAAHPAAYDLIRELLPGCGGRLAAFKNHSKVLVIRGEKWSLTVESSANMNERLIPHFENACVTVGEGPARWMAGELAKARPLNGDAFAEPYEWG